MITPELLEYPRFRVLARLTGEAILGGALTHEPADNSFGVVELSNVWDAPRASPDLGGDLIDAVRRLHPERAIVGYEQGDDLARAIDAGFAEVGTHRNWGR